MKLLLCTRMTILTAIPTFTPWRFTPFIRMFYTGARSGPRKKWCPDHVCIYCLAEVSNNFPLNIRILDSGTYKIANYERLWLFGNSLTERWASMILSIFSLMTFIHSPETVKQSPSILNLVSLHEKTTKTNEETSVWESCKII